VSFSEQLNLCKTKEVKQEENLLLNDPVRARILIVTTTRDLHPMLLETADQIAYFDCSRR